MYKIEKPLSIQERADFIVKYNHNKGLRIEETDKALYALEAWELLEGDNVIDNTEAWEAEQELKERERIAKLTCTKRVFAFSCALGRSMGLNAFLCTIFKGIGAFLWKLVLFLQSEA